MATMAGHDRCQHLCFAIFLLVVVASSPALVLASAGGNIGLDNGRRRWRRSFGGPLLLAFADDDEPPSTTRTRTKTPATSNAATEKDNADIDGGAPPAATAPTQVEEETPEESPLQSESVPLPKLMEGEEDCTSIMNNNSKQSRSFDIVPLPSILSKRRRRGRKSEEHQSSFQEPRQRKVGKPPSGTRFDLRAPNPRRITRWFALSPGEKTKDDSGMVFNHDSVGMTNPVLGVNGITLDNFEVGTASLALSTSSTAGEQLESIPAAATTKSPAQQGQQSSSNAAAARVLKLKQNDPDRQDRQEQQHREHHAAATEDAWFPATQNCEKRKWRQCRFRRRVGQGQECYERVRDAALEWQFQHQQHPMEGILPVVGSARSSTSGSSSNCFSLDESASQKVHPVWSGPHTVASRRLVTYTTTGFKTKWLPKLYTFNPVMVVYDILDQRGKATTYSSTAYATLKGHLLSGEERVTVALRDETGFVDVEILSYSRPASSMRGKLVWPLIGRMQQRFFEHQMDYLEGVASNAAE